MKLRQFDEHQIIAILQEQQAGPLGSESGLLPVLWTPCLGCRSLCFERHWAEIPQF